MPAIAIDEIESIERRRPVAVEVDPNEGLDPAIVGQARNAYGVAHPMLEILPAGIGAAHRLERKVFDITGKAREINASMRDLTELQKLLPRDPAADVAVTPEMQAVRNRLSQRGIDLFPPDAKTLSAEWVKKFQSTIASQEQDRLKTDLQLCFHEAQDYLQKVSSILQTMTNLVRQWERFIEKLIDNGVRR